MNEQSVHRNNVKKSTSQTAEQPSPPKIQRGSNDCFMLMASYLLSGLIGHKASLHTEILGPFQKQFHEMAAQTSPSLCCLLKFINHRSNHT